MKHTYILPVGHEEESIFQTPHNVRIERFNGI